MNRYDKFYNIEEATEMLGISAGSNKYDYIKKD